MQDTDLRGMIKCLVNDAIPLGQPKQRGDLLCGGVGIQFKMQSDLAEANRYIF